MKEPYILSFKADLKFEAENDGDALNYTNDLIIKIVDNNDNVVAMMPIALIDKVVLAND